MTTIDLIPAQVRALRLGEEAGEIGQYLVRVSFYPGTVYEGSLRRYIAEARSSLDFIEAELNRASAAFVDDRPAANEMRQRADQVRAMLPETGAKPVVAYGSAPIDNPQWEPA